MPSFDNLKQLKKYLDSTLKESIETDIKKEVIITIQEHIEDDVYNVYTPDIYNRKYNLEKSLYGNVKGSNGFIELTVEHDEDKMNYYSVVDGAKVDGNAVAQWINNGDIYPLWGTEGKNGKEFTYLNPRPYMDNAFKEIKDENVIQTTLRKSLEKKGIDSELI